MDACAELILVVDDERKIVDVVTSYLEKNGYRTSSAFDGKDALHRFASDRPALVILDWMLPDISGGEICRAIRRVSQTPVIMLTARVDEETVLKGFDYGADDYVTKPFSPRQLTARVEAILRRTESSRSRLLSFGGGALTIDFTAREVKNHGETVSLTPTEFCIISALARYPKKVFTREELIGEINADGLNVFDRIIDTHIKNIRQKLETDTKNPRYIRTVHGVGYRFGGLDA